MLVHQFVRTEFEGQAWDGSGAAKAGGRWNPPGLPAVYVSTSAGLAVAEVLANLEAGERLGDYVLLEAQVPDALVAGPPGVPEGWRTDEAATRAIGAQFLQDGKAMALRVPSAVVPGENLLLNPRHPDLAAVTGRRRSAMQPDGRLRGFGRGTPRRSPAGSPR